MCRLSFADGLIKHRFFVYIHSVAVLVAFTAGLSCDHAKVFTQSGPIAARFQSIDGVDN